MTSHRANLAPRRAPTVARCHGPRGTPVWPIGPLRGCPEKQEDALITAERAPTVTPFASVVARLRVPVTGLIALAVLLSVITSAPTTAPSSVAAMSAVAASSSSKVWGVYTGPGAKNVAGAADFAQKSGLPVNGVVDFPAETSWSEITGPAWLLDPYRGSGLALEYSLPLLPEGVGSDGAPWNLGD